MDLYILDDLLRRIDVIDLYESLIWSERYSAEGDFELKIHATRDTRNRLPAGTLLVINKSKRIMMVENIEKGVNDEGIATLTITGRELVTILRERIAKYSTANSTTEPKWEITGTPGAIARAIFDRVCVQGALDAGDVIPFYTAGSIYPAGSIAEPTETITVELEPQAVYDAIKNICDMYRLGFRMVRNGDTSELYFDVYTGHDRTTLQTTYSPVVFSSELDNLSDTSELTSTANYRNVAFVVAPNGTRYVLADNVDTPSGFERKVLYVDASDIDLAAGAALDAALEQRGKEELAKNRVVIAFDGEIPQAGSYEYEVDYGLGDLVEMRSDDGVSTNMRVTEQIFVSDAEGERSYPTLSIDLLITPGSWYAWDANQVWDDATEYWADA